MAENKDKGSIFGHSMPTNTDKYTEQCPNMGVQTIS